MDVAITSSHTGHFSSAFPPLPPRSGFFQTVLKKSPTNVTGDPALRKRTKDGGA